MRFARPIRLRMAALALASAALVALASSHDARTARAEERFSLGQVRAQVKSDYWQVKQLETAQLADTLAQGGGIVLIDVRESDEYGVSHIDSAQRVDPGIWRGTFLDKFESAVSGKTVVFYCSVGVRSSRLAARVQSALVKAGATAVYNLDGGIFAWHNERRPLRDGAGPTDFVHPFDAHWGKLLERREFARTAPVSAGQ